MIKKLYMILLVVSSMTIFSCAEEPKSPAVESAAGKPAVAGETVKLTILHINDTHGRSRPGLRLYFPFRRRPGGPARRDRGQHHLPRAIGGGFFILVGR